MKVYVTLIPETPQECQVATEANKAPGFINLSATDTYLAQLSAAYNADKASPQVMHQVAPAQTVAPQSLYGQPSPVAPTHLATSIGAMPVTYLQARAPTTPKPSVVACNWPPPSSASDHAGRVSLPVASYVQASAPKALAQSPTYSAHTQSSTQTLVSHGSLPVSAYAPMSALQIVTQNSLPANFRQTPGEPATSPTAGANPISGVALAQQSAPMAGHLPTLQTSSAHTALIPAVHPTFPGQAQAAPQMLAQRSPSAADLATQALNSSDYRWFTDDLLDIDALLPFDCAIGSPDASPAYNDGATVGGPTPSPSSHHETAPTCMDASPRGHRKEAGAHLSQVRTKPLKTTGKRRSDGSSSPQFCFKPNAAQMMIDELGRAQSQTPTLL